MELKKTHIYSYHADHGNIVDFGGYAMPVWYEGIKVEREELVRKEDETRIFGKKKERVFKDKITVENHKSRPITILLIDHIPVAQHEDIEVDEVEFSEQPTERDLDKGIIKWNLPLAPGTKKEITIEFTVTHPLDMIITGL